MTMVEKVADAMDAVPEWPAKTYRDRVARAAIEAMRDWPSVELRIDGIAGTPIGSGYGRRFWHAAIDSALDEHNAPEVV